MKKSVLIVALFSIFVVSSVNAQQNRQNRGDGNAMAQRMEAIYKDLNLTQDQMTKLKALQETNMKKMQEIRGDSKLTDEQRREKMMEFRKSQQSARDSILTPEQATKFNEKMREMRGNQPQSK
jgi:Spy/CpxP family protein refolding chaperone